MDVFGFDVMEVLDADADPSEVRDFLASMVEYVLSGGVTLHDGETIGFSAEDKHAIHPHARVSALPVMTLENQLFRPFDRLPATKPQNTHRQKRCT